jgi:hypothetical protein
MTKSIFAQLETNDAKEAGGVWVDYYAGDLHIRVKIARSGGANEAFTRLSNQLLKPYRRGNVNPNDIPRRTQLDLNARVYAETVVLDWEGVYDDDEKPIPYTVETGIAVFKRVELFLDFVMQEAANYKNFAASSRDDEIKN